MRAFALLGTLLLTGGVFGQDLVRQARDLEAKGSGAAARQLLERAVRQSPDSPAALGALATFLDSHGDPAAGAAYQRWLGVLEKSGAPQGERARVARRLVILSTLAEDRDGASKALQSYQAAGGSGLALPPARPKAAAQAILIPGPLPSFARMAALSPEVRPDDVLAGLSRNVVTNGYQALNSTEGLEQTEYLKLIIRYLSQARELQRLAGTANEIRLEQCDSPQTGELLKVLGYRMRGGCGSDVVLETVNASRAFLTIDSGFPLAELEAALRTNRPFALPYAPTQAGILYGPDYWSTAKDAKTTEFIDAFLADPQLCRLYLGLSKLDPRTSEELRKAVPVARLKAFAHVLDFFGGMMQIRDGKAVVPGGARSERGWADLVGAPPAQGAAFFEKLIAREDGWLASYFDALARIQGPSLEYLTEPDRMKRFYAALRGKVTSPGPARPVFRSNTELMLLTTRLYMVNGKPHVPGNLEVWKNLFINHPHGKYDGKLTKLATGWKDADDVIEALFALSRKAVENEPLRIYMALSDIDRRRATPLAPTTVDRLARAYRQYGSQYTIFSESPGLKDETILSFLDAASHVNDIRDTVTRADAAGIMQSLVSLWQILVRQGNVPPGQADAVLAELVTPYKTVKNQRELFENGRDGIRRLLAAAGSPDASDVQNRVMALLAGSSVESDARKRMVQEMSRIFEAQRLVSLQTIFDLDANLDRLARGEKLNPALVKRLVGRIAEIQLPRSAMSSTEKNAMAMGYFTEKHIDAQRRVRLDAAVEKAAADPEKLKDIRAQLTPFLRDTLVGLNYVHYAPPGAQILHTNPLFVRSHDFVGAPGSPQTWRSTEVFGTGWPANAGGRLVGSLSSLPYALAEAEQNFLIPSREQALIWGDLVPQMLQSAVIPRYWRATPRTLHWVGLHMRTGEAMLAEAALSAEKRKQVLGILERYAAPVRAFQIENHLENGEVRAALDQVLPSEQFLLASEAVSGRTEAEPAFAAEIQRLSTESSNEVGYAAVSRYFGTPKPTLGNTFQPELLHLRTFPTLMGYSSRIMAESWESNLLYFAALADELMIQPEELNLQIPLWTQQTVERIFATHLEDWPALLRSLRTVGKDIREKSRAPASVPAGIE